MSSQPDLFDPVPHAELRTPETLAEARARTLGAMEAGAVCPCCDQLVKLYRRKLAAAACAVLIRMYNRHGREPVHLVSFLGDEGLSASLYGDAARMVWWDLIEEVKGRPKQGGASRAGWYAVTEAGENFILGRISVAARVALYNNVRRPEYEDARQVTITQALGQRFSYAELMGRPAAGVDNTTEA